MARSAILSLRIVGDSQSAVKSLESAAGASERFHAKTAAVFGAVSGAVSSAVGKVIDYVSGLSGEMVETSDSAQSFANTLKFAGVDGSNIKKLTDATQNYADQTVYSLSDIRNTTAQLAANGVKGYGQLAEAAGNLNAVAGGTADTYQSVAMVITQTAGAGKLTTENWNQLSDAIPGASGRLQQALQQAGAYTGHFRDAMAKGQISADEFNQAIIRLGSSDAAKKAATDTSQLSNASGNLEAAVVKLGSKLLTLVKPTVTDFMSKLSNKVSDLASNVPQIIKSVGQFAQNLMNVAKNILPAVAAIGGFIAVIRVLYSIMMAGSILKWIKSFGMVKNAVRGATAAINMARNAQAALNLLWETNPAGIIITAIAAVVAGLTLFFTKTAAGRRIWAQFTNWLRSTWSQIPGFFRNICDHITGFFRSAGSNVQRIWNNVVNWFRGIPGKIGGFFRGIGDLISAPFRAAFSAIRGFWNSTIGGKGFDIPGWVPGIGGRSFRIPRLAHGGTLISAGTVMVGEHGPEYLTLPAGARVTPLSKAQPTGMTVNITINGALDPEATARQIRSVLSAYDRRRS